MNIFKDLLLGLLIAFVITSYIAVIISIYPFVEAVILADSDKQLLTSSIITGASFLGAILYECAKALKERLFN